MENNGTTTKTINYRYDKNGKTGWNNLLTGVDFSSNGTYETAETISYDNIGNPTKYLGASLDWYGRQLTSYTVEDDTNTTANETLKVTYTYDADGLRGTKTHNGTKSTYHYVSGQLRYETRGNLKFYYFYDASGNLSAIRYYPANSTDGYMYYPLTNAQGDVVSIYNSSGTPVVTYEYDAWGNCTIVSDTSGRNIGELNPIRYRGYYYDTETGLYYLQSRYYNPQVGRFLNSDNISDTGAGVLGNNTFIYCANNPVNAYDPTGHFVLSAILISAAIGAGVSAVSELGCQLLENGFNGVKPGLILRAAIIGGVCGAISGGVGAAIAKTTATVAAKAVANVIADGCVNVIETSLNAICDNTNLSAGDYIYSFASGTASSAYGSVISNGVKGFNTKKFAELTKGQKKAALNSSGSGQTFTRSMVSGKAYKSTVAYEKCISKGVQSSKEISSSAMTIFFNLFENEVM